MHIPCPNCATGWVLPETGHSHLRPCPMCHGTGYLTAQGSGPEAGPEAGQEVTFMRTRYGNASNEPDAGQEAASPSHSSFDPQIA